MRWVRGEREPFSQGSFQNHRPSLAQNSSANLDSTLPSTFFLPANALGLILLAAHPNLSRLTLHQVSKSTSFPPPARRDSNEPFLTLRSIVFFYRKMSSPVPETFGFQAEISESIKRYIHISRVQRTNWTLSSAQLLDLIISTSSFLAGPLPRRDVGS